jgi:hypothetical protein
VHDDEVDIVFKKLNTAVWKIGIPSDKNLRGHYLELLECALKSIHKAGVVHLDIYPSNIMWRVHPMDPTKIMLKVIDWDSVHYSNEHLSAMVRNRLCNYIGRDILALAKGNELFQYDLSLFDIIKENIDNEKFQSNEKRILDSIFQTCVSEKSNMLARLS